MKILIHKNKRNRIIPCFIFFLIFASPGSCVFGAEEVFQANPSVRPSPEKLIDLMAKNQLGIQSEEEMSVTGDLPTIQKAPSSNISLLNSKREEESLPWSKTILTSLFLCTLIALGAWGVQKLSKGKLPRRLVENEEFQILQNVSLGLKRQLVIARMGSSRLLIGLSGSQIQLLHTNEEKEIPQPKAVADPVITQKQVAASAKPPAFQSADPLDFDFSRRIQQVLEQLGPISFDRKKTSENSRTEKTDSNRIPEGSAKNSRLVSMRN